MTQTPLGFALQQLGLWLPRRPRVRLHPDVPWAQAALPRDPRPCTETFTARAPREASAPKPVAAHLGPGDRTGAEPGHHRTGSRPGLARHLVAARETTARTAEAPEPPQAPTAPNALLPVRAGQRLGRSACSLRPEA